MSISRAPGLVLAAVMTLFVGVAESGDAPESRRPPVLDPSEEITSEELSTIPEPVPGAPRSGEGARPRSSLPRAQAASQRDSMAIEGPVRTQGALWRVQIFATQDRDLADRMAMEAGDLLKVPAYVANEPPHYKVRLGDYGSEEDARPLREKAVRLGFPGAFRVRCPRNVTGGMD